MKKTQYLLLTALGCGLILLLLDWLLFYTATDPRGLIVAGSISNLCLTSFTIACLAWFCVQTRKSACFLGVACHPAAVAAGFVTAACCVAMLTMQSWAIAKDLFSYVTLGLGTAAAASMLAGAVMQVLRVPASVVTSLFFAVHSVLRYRVSSADPQLHDYVFPLLAEIVLMLYFYHFAAVQKGEDNPWLRNLWRCSAIILCCGAIFRGGFAFAVMLPSLFTLRGDEN